MTSDIRIVTCSSSATLAPDCAGQVIVSGSYGGEYNAWHAAKWRIRGVILSDAGVGKHNAGTKGLPYLDRIGLPAAPPTPTPVTSPTATTFLQMALSAMSTPPRNGSAFVSATPYDTVPI
jgi:hypothetical protein